MDSMNPSEIGVLGAVCLYVIDKLFKMIPKAKQFTEEDIKRMQFDTNMKGTLDTAIKLLEKLSDKGDRREHILDDIANISENSHKRIGKIESHTETLSKLYATTKFCKEQ